MKTKPHYLASCTCGQVTLEAVGAPMLSAICYCESCRKAGREFEQAPGAPRVINASNGVDYCIFRKDRVRVSRGGVLLKEHRLTADSPTRRVVAGCCNAPMFVDFTKGHWLTLYRDRVPDAPPLQIGVMAKDLPEGAKPREDIPAYATFSPKAMVGLMLSWAAMGFPRPRFEW
jgi:hypothetical protein